MYLYGLCISVRMCLVSFGYVTSVFVRFVYLLLGFGMLGCVSLFCCVGLELVRFVLVWLVLVRFGYFGNVWLRFVTFGSLTFG